MKILITLFAAVLTALVITLFFESPAEPDPQGHILFEQKPEPPKLLDHLIFSAEFDSASGHYEVIYNGGGGFEVYECKALSRAFPFADADSCRLVRSRINIP